MKNIYDLKIFSGIDKSIVNNIIKNCNIEKFITGEIIFLKGEESNGKGYIIKSGIVLVEIGSKIITKLGPGELFGEIALFSEEQRTATIKAYSDVEVIVLSQENLLELVDNGNETINKDLIHRLEQNLTINN